MKKLESYIINPLTVLITGEYDYYGKLCTRVLEGKKSFLVNQTPKKVLDESIMYIGYDLKGAIKSARKILGPSNMSPFMVNLPLGLCMFPDKSMNEDDCIFFSITHVKTPEECGHQTKVPLSFGHSIILDTRITLFKKKLNKAIHLARITSERSQCPVTFFMEPKSKYQLVKKPGGRYNFAEIENPEE